MYYLHVSITKGKKQETDNCLQKVEQNVHTFLYVKKLYYNYSGLELLVSITELYIKSIYKKRLSSHGVRVRR